MNHGSYTDDYLRAILREARVIAMVGASVNWNRPSHFAMKYLQSKGYRVIPVNPSGTGSEILGELCYASLAEVPVPIDMVDIFRTSDAVPPLVDEAIRLEAKIVWMQLGVRHDAAALRAEAAGLKVVMDRCPKIEYARLTGELGWNGVDTGIISARRARPI